MRGAKGVEVYAKVSDVAHESERRRERSGILQTDNRSEESES
jgi:hypothetical protein